MDSSTKRKVGAIALIVAGIGAFLVPFLLRGPALQASSNGGGNGGTTPTSSTCTTNCSSDTTPPTCSSDQTTNSDSSQGKHLAKGHDKQDTSIVGKAHGFMAAMAKHNPQHDATHSTKVDNDTTNTHRLHSNGNSTNDANACADNKDNDNSDDQSNDD